MATTDTDLILSYMDQHPGTSARAAADALGLPASSARAARKARNASRARARDGDRIVQLAPVPLGRDAATETAIEFWTNEVYEIYGKRQDASGIAYNNCTRDLHNARRELELARAALPSKPPGETDAELLQELSEELGLTAEQIAGALTG